MCGVYEDAGVTGGLCVVSFGLWVVDVGSGLWCLVVRYIHSCDVLCNEQNILSAASLTDWRNLYRYDNIQDKLG